MDWIAAACNILGMWFLPRKKYLGMCFFLGSSLLFLIWAVGTKAWAVATLQLVLIVLNFRTIYLWRQKNHGDRSALRHFDDH